VFAELVKRYGKEAVYFWRTSDKKEIDFILKIREQVLPIEVKLNFSHFNPSAVNHFLKEYGLQNYRLLGFEGESTNPQARRLWQDWE
jgi:predicted AAA+ superfamily ATPase